MPLLDHSKIDCDPKDDDDEEEPRLLLCFFERKRFEVASSFDCVFSFCCIDYTDKPTFGSNSPCLTAIWMTLAAADFAVGTDVG